MSNFKIIVNPKADNTKPNDLTEQLTGKNYVLYYSSKSIAFKKGDELYLVMGKVDGIKRENGDLTNIINPELEQVIISSKANLIREKLDGRFIILRCTPTSIEILSDRFGQRDVYYTTDEGSQVIASSMKFIDKSFKQKFDQAALAHSLMIYGFRPAKKQTIFSAIKRLGVGETLTLSNDKISLEQEKFVAKKAKKFTEEDLAKYSQYFLEGLKLRGSDKGNIVFLSSGWDSTTILAGLVQVFGKHKVRAVIGRMHFSERSGNHINKFEIDRAKAVADHFGVPLDIVELDYYKEGPKYLEEMKEVFQGHHIASTTAITWWLLAKKAKEINPEAVLFHGEVSDGAHNLGFSQFVSIFHPSLEFREYSDKMMSYLFGPSFFQSVLNGQHEKDLIFNLLKTHYFGEQKVLEKAENNRAGLARQMIEGCFLRPARFPFYSVENSKLLTAEGSKNYVTQMSSSYLNDATKDMSEENYYSWMIHLYNSFHWQGSTVASYGYAAEAESLVSSLPFLDSRVQDFLMEMPENFGRGLEILPTKYPLKWMLKNAIKNYPFHLQTGPHSYLYDVEHTFNHNAELLFASAFTSKFKSVLAKAKYKKVLDKAFFDLDYLDLLVKKYLDGVEFSGQERSDLFSLVMLEMTGILGE